MKDLLLERDLLTLMDMKRNGGKNQSSVSEIVLGMSPRALIGVQSEVPTPSSFVKAIGGLCSEIRDLAQQQKLCFGREMVSSPVVVLSQVWLRIYGTATHVKIELPIPTDATNPNVRTSLGSASYAPEKDALIWKIKSFPGGKTKVEWIKPNLVFQSGMINQNQTKLCVPIRYASFGLEYAYPQVFSQDKSIYEAVENAFITIYVRKIPVETAKNLLYLAIDSNIGDLAALEFIVGALVSKGDITASTVCFSSRLSIISYKSYFQVYPLKIRRNEVLIDTDHCYCVILNADGGAAFPSEKTAQDCSSSDISSLKINTGSGKIEKTKCEIQHHALMSCIGGVADLVYFVVLLWSFLFCFSVLLFCSVRFSRYLSARDLCLASFQIERMVFDDSSDPTKFSEDGILVIVMIRQSSVELSGDLLFKVAGTFGKALLEGGSDDEGASTEEQGCAIIEVLGREKRNEVLAALYMVTGRSLGELVRKLGERVLPLIIPILSRGLKDPNASRRQVRLLTFKFYFVDLIFLIAAVLPHILSKLVHPPLSYAYRPPFLEGIEPLISELLKGVGDHQASIRRSSSYLLGYFFKNSKLYLVDEAPNVITTLIVLLVAWEALSRVVGLVPKEVLPSYIKLVCDAVSTSRDKERRKRKGGPVLILGLCLPKALQPLLPIFLHGLISGSAELREQTAQGLGELIEVTSE
ncbi:Protein ILITYHIA [Camellia lanceoleosa]|uniref:Protein ILITYHIA n=1 Tax=Camellia lanceoleosa TaxID=1840588 RepID=A0ACC0GJG6_9ERIC|nr:Protein ILITYHIA [Camellia lanceoleosa]